MSAGGRPRRAGTHALVALVALAVGVVAVEVLARLLDVVPVYGRVFSVADLPTRTVDGVVLWSDHAPRATAADVQRAAADHGAFTIVGLGDSIMYGIRLPPEATYLEQARARLAARAGRPVEILNLATPGFNTVQEDAVHKEVAAQLAADLVLLHHWVDDGRQYRVSGGYVIDVGDMSADGRLIVRALPVPPALNDFLLVHSRLYDLLTQAAVARDRRAVASDWNGVAASLAAIAARARAGGGRLVVLASPELDGTRPRPSGDLPALRHLAAAHGFEVIDLADWLDGAASAHVALDGCHLNAEGHRRIGEHLTEYLLADDLRG